MTDTDIIMFVVGCFVGVLLCAVLGVLGLIGEKRVRGTATINELPSQPYHADRPVEPIPPCATDHESMRALGEGLIEIAQFLAGKQSSAFELKPTQTTKIVDRCLSSGNVILAMYPKKKAKLAVTEHTAS